MPKRKCTFNETLKAKYPCFKEGRNKSEAYCILCNSYLNIGNKGITDIEDHLKTEKHKRHVRGQSNSGAMDSFVINSSENSAIRAAEAVLSFHTVKHHQSFRSMDCTSKLLQTMFSDSTIAKKITCGRTKTEAIIQNILGPFSLDICRNELENVQYVSVATDGSNHGANKLFPIVIQFFKFDKGIKSYLLDIVSVSNEKATTISEILCDTLRKFNISQKVIAFSGDNCNTNFGGIKRKGENNVYSILKTTINPHLIGVGCPAHLLNNAVHHGMGQIPVDIESMVLKIYNYFSIYTVRTENLKEMCDFVEVEYEQLLYHSKTRWLSLFPAIERLLKVYDALKSYFFSQDQCPVHIKKFFEDEFTEPYLWVTHSLMHVFHTNIKNIEKKESSIIEVVIDLENVREKLLNRKNSNFLPLAVKSLLKTLKENGHVKECDVFLSNVLNLYDSCLQYLDAWLEHFKIFSTFSWLNLYSVNENTLWEEVQSTIQFLNSKDIHIDDVKTFDEFVNLKKFIGSIKLHTEKKMLHEVWCDYFRSCVCVEQYGELFKIVQFYFAIPGHNANVERIFSLIQSQWTKERNRFTTDNIKGLMFVQYNFQDLSCADFYEKIKNNSIVLGKIGKSEKYVT